jgi:hypothetical protein
MYTTLKFLALQGAPYTRIYDISRLRVNETLSRLLTQHVIRMYQYSETSVMHFLFSLLRIKGLYMFRALLAHPQGTLHKRYLVLGTGYVS